MRSVRACRLRAPLAGPLSTSSPTVRWPGSCEAKTGTLNPSCNPGQLGSNRSAAICRRPDGGAIEFVLLQNGECIANNYKTAVGPARPGDRAIPERPDSPKPRAAVNSLMAVMPMFPLGTVLLPGVVLPLHVFEPRYQQLVHDCLEAPAHEFGVVLIDRGSEVGGGDSRSGVGVVAQMLQVARWTAVASRSSTIGTRRIRVTQWLPDDPYPRADVEEWPDTAGADVSARTARRRRRTRPALCRTRRRDG